MHTSAELREGFLSFFESKGHKRHPSGPLIPRADDRSTLLTVAGMQPLMPYFLGREQPPAPLLTTAQKSFRTPDIDDVGLDGHHLTFFEMLGNFSFGQYFKEGAIDLAWEFVTQHLRLDADRIWISVFAGDPELHLDEDSTAVGIWERIGVPPERIVRLPRAHNFWSVGGPGPCGPDTELFFDRGPDVGCRRPECAPGCECERFLEFWNLVFMEFELRADGTVTPLPQQNVDTGLGLERTSALLQDVLSVYETDGYQAIMDWIAAESGVGYGESGAATKAHRILADHGRGMTFLTVDGVVPSNEGRGYVLRRIIRRAVQQARVIGLEDLWRLTDVVSDQMSRWYPELAENRARVQEIVRAEEEQFGRTLERGMREFEKAAEGGAISGADAFRLHDTYGFPIELTRELARDRGLPVDDDEFERLMDEQRERSRGAVDFQARLAGAAAPTEFVGYDTTEVLTAITALEQLDDGLFQAKLERSPFYPEGGGQVGDEGYIEKEDETRAELVRAIRLGDDQELVFRGEGFAAGDRVRAVVPWAVRFPTMTNHTATHLLHRALRIVLGDHVQQAGSAVRPDKLRFDFTQPQALTPEQRHEVERLVNEKIFENLPVHAFVVPIEEARNLGAMMLFEEKYGEHVRVVEVPGFSRELCGGTHVRSTAEIGPLVILAESSIASGVRRIEAVTSGEAYAYLAARSREVDELGEELQRLRKEVRKGPAKAEADFVLRHDESADGVNVVIGEVRAGDLLDVADRLKQQRRPAAVVLGAVEGDKVSLVAMIDSSLEARLDAVDWIKAAATPVGGGGGGRRTMARAGGRNPEKLPEALDSAWAWIKETLG